MEETQPANQSQDALVIPPSDQALTPPVTMGDAPASQKKSGSKKMLVLAVVVLLIVIVLAIAGFFVMHQNSLVSPMASENPAAMPIASVSPSASASATTSTSDQQLNTDLTNITNTINSAQSDVTNADNGMTDKGKVDLSQ